MPLLSKLRAEVEAPLGPDSIFSKRWDLVIVEEPRLAKNRGLAGQNIAQIAKARGKDPLDTFLDLAVEKELNTSFSLGETNTDTEAGSDALHVRRRDELLPKIDSIGLGAHFHF